MSWQRVAGLEGCCLESSLQLSTGAAACCYKSQVRATICFTLECQAAQSRHNHQHEPCSSWSARHTNILHRSQNSILKFCTFRTPGTAGTSCYGVVALPHSWPCFQAQAASRVSMAGWAAQGWQQQQDPPCHCPVLQGMPGLLDSSTRLDAGLPRHPAWRQTIAICLE